MAEPAFLNDLECRLRSFFAEQAAGFDVPPATLYRLEGAMDAAVQLGAISQQQLREKILALAEEFLPEPLQHIYRPDSRLLLHLHMAEAPVYPSGGK